MFKLSADDIVQQSFGRSFRGYDPDQVDEFLRAVAREWKQMRAELDRARSEAEERASELEDYRDRERELCEALETAKNAADDIREEAEREAELTIEDAEVEADRILSEVEREVEALQEDIARLRHQRQRYRAELRSLLESHMELVEEMDEQSPQEGISRSPSVGSEPSIAGTGGEAGADPLPADADGEGAADDSGVATASDSQAAAST